MENNWVEGRLQINLTDLKDERETTRYQARSQVFQREEIRSAKLKNERLVNIKARKEVGGELRDSLTR